MKHPLIRSRRMRYGGMTVYLTVTLIAVLVLLNIIFSALANYYTWYIDMTPEKLYSVTDLCRSLLGDAIDDAEEQSDRSVKLEIIFCEDYREYEKGEAGHYIYNTAHELELAFPDHVSVEWFDCWVEKSRAVELGVTSSTNIVLKLSDDSIPAGSDTTNTRRVFGQKEFFVFEGTNTTSPAGYDGERVFATTMASMLISDRPLALLSVNHDEIYFDDTLMYLLRDAGYNIDFIDLYYTDIPEECELLVIYNPNNDFIVADGISEKDEIVKLEQYLAAGGQLLTFLSASSPELPAYEGLLADWGVSIGRIYDDETGYPYNVMVKDSSVSLTADGMTILADYTKNGPGAELTAHLREDGYAPRVVFRDATVLLPAEGYTAASDGSYRMGTKTRADIFVGSPSAKAWSSGSEPDGYDEALSLMSTTVDSATGARVTVCASTEYASEEYLQSAVFGNADVMLSLFKEMGLEDVMVGLRYKPFTTDQISSITTAQMLRWTLGLTITPAVIILAVATFVLVRRKYS